MDDSAVNKWVLGTTSMRPFSTVRTMTLPRLDDARVILDGLDAAQRGCVLRQLLLSIFSGMTLFGSYGATTTLPRPWTSHG